MPNRAKMFLGNPAALAVASLPLFWFIPLMAADAPPTTAPATQPSEDHPADATASIRRWFNDLANSDSAVRSDALTNLMGISADDLPILQHVVEETKPLAPAQASVLKEIVAQVLLSGEHYESHADIGFLGVHLEPTAVSFRDLASGLTSVPTAGVVIVDRMPGFAGARMLRDGDVILSILDRPDTPVKDANVFMLLIKSMRAGATVNFQILRQGQVIGVPVKLDPRPVESDQNFGMGGLLDRRREHVEEYWMTHFAELVKQSVS